MTALPAISVSGCDSNDFLLAKPDATSNSPARRRPWSITPSMRSSRSRFTLVGEDLGVATYNEIKLDVSHDVTTNTRMFSWLDHLLAVFCIYRPGKIILTPREKTTGPEDLEVCHDSPWVLPVYVLSTRKDTDNHQVPKEAKCTIDTGNMQGNIVSRAFVEVLGYSESSFHMLTKAEKEGGTGITGHKLIPEGAIYLTWYHNKSTRVFRDMRFLVLEHPMCDLIIGARSIQENNILDVPNLMLSRTKYENNLDSKKKGMRDEHLKNYIGQAEYIVKLKNQLTEARKYQDTPRIEELQKKLAEINATAEKKSEDDVAKLQGHRDQAAQDQEKPNEPLGSKMLPSQKKPDAPLGSKILPSQKKPDEPLSSKILSSTTESSTVPHANMGTRRDPNPLEDPQ